MISPLDRFFLAMLDNLKLCSNISTFALTLLTSLDTQENKPAFNDQVLEDTYDCMFYRIKRS